MAGYSRTYTESENVKKLRQAAESLAASKPGDYVSANGERLSQLYSSLQNRPAFSYNPEEDGLYQAYRKQYTNLGRRAMEDTLGQAAALTGGYGSSYSQNAGQQAYDSYLIQLTNKIPELAQTARSAYDSEGDRLAQQYNLLSSQENQDYSRWRDTVSDYYTRLQQANSALNTERSFDYNAWRDGVADSQWQAQYDYNARRDAVKDSQWQAEYNLSLAKAAASSSGSSGSSGSKSSGKTEKTYDGMTDSQLTSKVKTLLTKFPAAQVSKILQGSASGLTATQAKRALTLLKGLV